MTEPVAARMQVVRKQDKVPRLKDFIRVALAAIADDPCRQDERRCLVVARSHASPVLRALADFHAELQGDAFSVRIILSAADVDATDSETGWIANAAVRLARNARLIDAHEFMVLGRRASWVGDSMRRDPSKRDAFEDYRADDNDATARAVRSFERLWALSDAPVRVGKRTHAAPARTSPEAAQAEATAGLPAATQDGGPPPISGATRH